MCAGRSLEDGETHASLAERVGHDRHAALGNQVARESFAEQFCKSRGVERFELHSAVATHLVEYSEEICGGRRLDRIFPICRGAQWARCDDMSRKSPGCNGVLPPKIVGFGLRWPLSRLVKGSRKERIKATQLSHRRRDQARSAFVMTP